MAANDTPRVRNCGTMLVHERLLRTDPSYLSARVASENRAWEAATFRIAGRTGITVIPVVVHVVYRTNTQNIADTQIQSQIEVLNRDFRKTNPDAASTPAAFSALVADARIEFELATTDPQGNPTTGITRTQTNVASFGSDDGVKSAGSGGVDAWPADRYLNIWVCELGGGLLGYAQFPGGPAATDGVVILHSGFGTNGTAAAPFNLGRTATHEIGHWVNLRHIWGDDGSGCSGDDFVTDTPNQAGSNTGMPSFPRVSCNNGPNGDLFMNYMDYTDDAGMFMFTHGQVTRMQATLDGDRISIGYQKPAPVTLKFRDDINTLKFRDDVATLKFRDDNTTLKFRDDMVTNPRLDPIKDPQLDKPPIMDRAKMPSGDLAQGTTSDRSLQRVGPAPFILSTPHHSTAWARSYAGAYEDTMAAYEAQIAEYEQFLEQYSEAEAAGQLTASDIAEAEQLYAEYVRLVDEYYQLSNG